MSASPLRAAVIGCGAIAYEHLPYLAASPRAELVAVCDRSPALAEAARARFAAPSAYDDAGTMLAAMRPDVVHILTPPQTHAFLVRQALAAGAHVICEKPMTGTAAETDALLRDAREAGRVLIESRNLLFNDPVIELRQIIAAGRLGKMLECEVSLSVDFLAGPFGDPNLEGSGVGLPGGAVHDFLPHLVYLYQCLNKQSEVTEIKGSFSNLSGNDRAGFDFVDVLLSGPVRGRLHVASDTAPSAFKVIVRGSLATVETDLYNPGLQLWGAPNVGKRSPLGQIANGRRLIRAGFANFRNKVKQHGTSHGLPRMLDAIYKALQDGSPQPFSDDEILATARLVDRIVALGDAA